MCLLTQMSIYYQLEIVNTNGGMKLCTYYFTKENEIDISLTYLEWMGSGIFSKNKNWSYATNVEKLSTVEGYILLAQ